MYRCRSNVLCGLDFPTTTGFIANANGDGGRKDNRINVAQCDDRMNIAQCVYVY